MVWALGLMAGPGADQVRQAQVVMEVLGARVQHQEEIQRCWMLVSLQPGLCHQVVGAQRTQCVYLLPDQMLVRLW